MCQKSENNLITLIAVGDIMLGEDSLCIGHGVSSKIKKYGTSYPFQMVASYLTRGDIVFGNLEAVLSNEGINNRNLRSLQMRAKPEAVEGLKYAGFNVISLANNHSLEHGKEALSDTMRILASSNINYIGVDAMVNKARKPLIIEVKGISIAFLAYCLSPDQTAFISTSNNEEICSDVYRARAKADIVVVSLHWGCEYIERPSPEQIGLAHQIIDSGATLILGHHPHVLQRIEEYHKGVIAYSLGNFVFDMNYLPETRKSIIFECTLSKTCVEDYKAIPTFNSDEHAPYILSGEQNVKALEEFSKLSIYITDEKPVNYDEEEVEYRRKVEQLRNQNRRQMMRFFAGNIFMYSPRFAYQIIKSYVIKHLR